MKTFAPNYPAWMCETHIREIEDMIESGEIGEAKELWAYRQNLKTWCNDCKAGA